MTDRRRGLGRGLGALIPTSAPPREPEADPKADLQADAEPDAPTAPVPTVVEVAPTAPVAEEEAPGPVPDEPTVPDEPVQPVGGWSADEDGLVAGAYFAEIPIHSITPNPMQPRHVFEEEQLAELVHSIKEIGLLQPIVVRPLGGDKGEEKYELIMGERRWRASQLAGFEAIPAIVRETEDESMLVDALLENLHRAALNPLEEAAAYDQLLKDFDCTHEQLAAKIGRSRPQISNTIRLLKLPPSVQRRVAAGVLSAGHARALLALDDPAAQEHLAGRIIAEGLSVRTVEELVTIGDTNAKPTRTVRAGRRTAPALDDLAANLGDQWDTRVKVQLGANKGRIVVEFASVEDLERLVSLMSPGTMLGLFAESEYAVTRRLVNITLDNLDELPVRCRSCVYWELDPVAAERAAKAGDPGLEKEAWVSATLLEWGSCGKLVQIDGVTAGYVMFSPPVYVPRSVAFPTSPVSGDAVLLTTGHVLPEFSGQGLGRMLIQGVAKDMVRRGVKAIEAFGDAKWKGPGCLVPADYLLAVGFKTVRPHHRFPRLRLEVKSAVSWREDVEVALERLLGSMTPEPAFRPV